MTWVGLKVSDDALFWKADVRDATKCLFELIAALLEQARVDLNDIESVAYCEGPGSMLGIRTVSMAIRAWKASGAIDSNTTLFSYASLAAGSRLARDNEAFLVTDARRQSWNALSADHKDIVIIENETLEKREGAIISLEGFPVWTKTDAIIETIPYSLEKIFGSESSLEILKRSAEAGPLILRESEYKKWEPRIQAQ